MRFGNGRTLTKTYDRNYTIDRVGDDSPAGVALDFTTDAVGNIVGLSEQQGNATAVRSISYDGQNRLIALHDGVAAVQIFTYDPTGNRTSASDGSATNAYGLTTGSHRLTSVGASSRSYDASGNTTSISGATQLLLSYDERGRLNEVSEDGIVKTRYRYNSRGERVAKLYADPSRSRWFVYADEGMLLGEYDSSGARVAEYVWLDRTLIAVLSDHVGSNYQFIETDHIGSSRAVVHPLLNTIIWRWDLSTTAFGEHAALRDPDADGVEYEFNLRFPGQYLDSESGLHQNRYRDYDPAIGRYVESDPIGLHGGISTYEYAESNPLYFVDPEGLSAQPGSCSGCCSNVSWSNREGGLRAATIRCCGGTPTACVNPNLCRGLSGGACAAQTACVRRHEQMHVERHSTCQGISEGGPAEPKSPHTKPSSECQAYRIDYSSCYSTNKCGRDRRCIVELRRMREFAESQRDKYCSQAGM